VISGFGIEIVGGNPYFPFMKKITIVALLALLRMMAGAQAPAPAPVEKYPVDSASVEHAGVPKGELVKCSFDHSAIFPGTHRDYWIYIPAQYKPDHRPVSMSTRMASSGRRRRYSTT